MEHRGATDYKGKGTQDGTFQRPSDAWRMDRIRRNSR